MLKTFFIIKYFVGQCGQGKYMPIRFYNVSGSEYYGSVSEEVERITCDGACTR